jgi:hypothetical protein
VTLADPTMYLSHRPADIGNQRYQLQLARNGSNADPSLPLLITEWSSSPSSRAPYHDSWEKAAFVIAAVVDATDAPGLNLSAYSFWAFTDIFTEQGFPSHSIPYHGGFGLLNVSSLRVRTPWLLYSGSVQSRLGSINQFGPCFVTLFAQVYGVPKPAYRSFELLHKSGDNQIRYRLPLEW